MKLFNTIKNGFKGYIVTFVITKDIKPNLH